MADAVEQNSEIAVDRADNVKIYDLRELFVFIGMVKDYLRIIRQNHGHGTRLTTPRIPNQRETSISSTS